MKSAHGLSRLPLEMAHSGAVRRLWALLFISTKHLAREGRDQTLLPETSLEWDMSTGLRGGRGRKNRQRWAASWRQGWSCGKCGALGLPLHEQGNTEGNQAVLVLSSSCLLALGGDESKGHTKLVKRKWAGAAEKRVLVS